MLISRGVLDEWNLRQKTRNEDVRCLSQNGAAVDDMIERLLEGRHVRPGKPVQLAEPEIRQLCIRARDIFLEQPNLLELDAPIKICGGVSMTEEPVCLNFVFGYLCGKGYLRRFWHEKRAPKTCGWPVASWL